MFLFLLLFLFLMIIIVAKSKAKEIKKFEKKTGIKVKSLEEYEISKEAVKQAQIELKKEEYNKIKENKKATK